MNVYPAGAEPESDDEDGELPAFIAEQIGHHGFNVNNVMNLFDGLDLVDYEFDIDADDFFDDDDEDWYDEYYDSDFEFRSDDEDEETSRKILTGIFKTLEDSGPVLNKLTFHRESSKETGSRLPRILPGQTETYETLHKLLEETELLLKVWKNRVNHPFTAHLERKPEENNKEPDSGANASGGLIMGKDYQESDVESDTTDHRYNFRSRTNVNMTLTRKKYCQSTKMYYNIFASEHEFEVLQGQIKAMKKHIFNIAFNLFLQNLPGEKLPNELWEKIWKMTLRNAEPDMPPTHSCGVREKSSRKWTLFENERITDCFGAAGNLHLILFEILFKHPYIMTSPQMFEMETTGNLAKFKYFRLYFLKFVRLLSMKFARLEILDQGVPKQLPSPLTNSPESLIRKRIEKGQFYITNHNVQVNGCAVPSMKALFMVFAQEQSPYLAIAMHGPDNQVMVCIWDMVRSKEVAKIHTGLGVTDVCMMLKSGSASSQKFSLTSHQFSLLCPNEHPTGDIEFFKWKLNLDPNCGELLELSAAEKQCLIIDPEIAANESHVDLTLMTQATGQMHVIQFSSYQIQEWASEKRCSIIIVDGTDDQPRLLKRVALPTLPNGFPKLTDYKNEKYLFYHYSSDSDKDTLEENKVWFFDILQEKIIEDYRMADMCELTQQPCCNSEDNNDRHLLCAYDGRFDLGRNQFIVFKEFLSGFVIFQYDDDDENGRKKPRIVNKGSMFCHLSTRSTFLLLNGVIFATCQKETEMMPLTPDSVVHRYEHDNDAMELIAVDLEVKQGQTLTSFGVSAHENSKLLLNETHRAIIYQLKDHFSGWPSLRSVTDTTLVMQSTKSAYIKIDLGISPEAIAHAEAEAMYAKQMEKEKALTKAEETKRKVKAKEKAKKEAKEKIVQKYFNSDEHTVQGPIYNWKRSWGFMRPKGEAKVLENIFVHYSNIVDAPPRKSIKNGIWVKCKVTKDEDRANFKAVDILLVPKPEPLNGTATSVPQSQKGGSTTSSRGGRENSRGRHGGRGKRRGGGGGANKAT